MKKFKLSIDKPCYESWEGMTPNQQGKFCGACVKTVVDFSQKSDAEIIDFFKKHKNESTCGRFKEQQLNTVYQENSFAQKNIAQPIAAALVPALLLASTSSNAQNKVRGEVAIKPAIHKPVTSQENITSSKVKNKYKENTKSYTIRVADSIQGVIANASIYVNGIDYGKTNEYGLIVVKLNPNEVNNCVIQANKYEALSIELTEPITAVHLKPLVLEMQEVVVTSTYGSYIQGLLTGYKSFSKKKEETESVFLGGAVAYGLNVSSSKNNKTGEKKSQEPIHPKLNIYPNPVNALQQINIETKTIAEGNYVLSLISNNGTVLDSKTFFIKGQNIQYNLPAQALSGQYYIALLNKKTKLRLTASFIVL